MGHSGLLLFYLCSHTPPTTRSHTRAYVTRMKNNICFYLCSPTPPTTRSHTCAYVTLMKDNFPRNFEPRHVIPDTRSSSGRSCVTSMLHSAREISKVTRNKRELRHIHVKKSLSILRILRNPHMWYVGLNTGFLHDKTNFSYINLLL
jgi:hypothetical protein